PDKYYAFTWIELFNATQKSIPWFSVSFPSEGIAVGASGAGVTTTRDGEDWTSFAAGSASENFYTATIPYKDTSFIAGYDGSAGLVRKLIRTGSTTYTTQNVTSPGANAVNDITFPLASRAGYCVTDGGGIYRSTNFANSWVKQNPPVANFSKNLHSLALVDFT